MPLPQAIEDQFASTKDNGSELEQLIRDHVNILEQQIVEKDQKVNDLESKLSTLKTDINSLFDA